MTKLVDASPTGRHQQQDHVHQASNRRLSERRELQERDLFLLRWTRSLPTIMPDGPEKTGAFATIKS
jgi:hypothetical protein